MEEMGKEKLYFPFWKSVKRQKAHLGRSVSTNFVADCMCAQLTKRYNK